MLVVKVRETREAKWKYLHRSDDQKRNNGNCKVKGGKRVGGSLRPSLKAINKEYRVQCRVDVMTHRSQNNNGAKDRKT